MKNALLDTQLLLWLAMKPNKVPDEVKEIILADKTGLWFSHISIWEVSIKFGLRRADFDMSPAELLRGLREAGFLELPIRDAHLVAVADLPLIHRDPFDRLLVAQAKVEGSTLLTTDKMLSKYGSFVRRV